MQTIFKNPTARAIAESVTERDLAALAWAEKLQQQDVADIFFDLLDKVEKNEAGIIGNPVGWARKTFKFEVWNFKKNQPVLFSSFANPEAAETAVVAEWSVLEHFGRLEESEIPESAFELLDVEFVAKKYGYCRKTAKSKINQVLQKAEKLKKAGASRAKIIKFCTVENPIFSRQRAPKRPQGGSPK